MRKLMWFVIGFALAACLWAYGIGSRWGIPIVLAAMFLMVGQIGRQQKGLRVLPFAALGLIFACFWTHFYQQIHLAPALTLDGSQQELTITASDYSYDTGYGLAVDGSIVLDGKRFQIRAYLEESDDISDISPGDTIRGQFLLGTTVPGGAEESMYHQGKGIFLMAYGRGEATLTPAEEPSFWEYPAILTRKIENILQNAFPEDIFPFAKALLLGDSTGLNYETDTNLKISGIRHIIAVSGLHVSVLYGAIAALTRRRRFLTALIGIPVLVLFAAMVGFTPSVTRACIMVGLMMLSSVFLRQYDSATALSFACLVMLLVNPLVITSASLQLSVGCVAGILLFQQPIKGWLLDKLPGRGRWRSQLAGSISVTLSAMSLVTPLSAYYFGSVSLIGVVTNLLTLWVVSGVFIGIIGVCILGFLSTGLAAGLGWVLAWPIRYVLAIAKLCASVPFGAVYTASSYIVFWLIFCYLLLTVFLFQRNRRPGILCCCAALGLCLALMLSYLEPVTDDTRVTMLDVGQGQAILLQCEGKTFLVDCGGDSDTETADIISETLLSQGIAHLDGLILTHYDRDHAGALDNLLTRIDADLLILPDTPNKMVPKNTGGEIHYLWDQVEISFGTGKITVFGPIFHGVSNENSLCVLFDTEKCDILITGDRTDFGERMLLRKAALPEVDILVAGHHGAESSTSKELLRACTPETVLISVGEENYYGHPNPKLLQRLADFGCTVRRTDQEGTIIIRR